MKMLRGNFISNYKVDFAPSPTKEQYRTANRIAKETKGIVWDGDLVFYSNGNAVMTFTIAGCEGIFTITINPEGKQISSRII